MEGTGVVLQDQVLGINVALLKRDLIVALIQIIGG
jgi:hypothetical protein